MRLTFVWIQLFSLFSGSRSEFSAEEVLRDMNANYTFFYELSADSLGPNIDVSWDARFHHTNKVKFNCTSLFRDFSSNYVWPPPTVPPDDMIMGFSMDHTIPIVLFEYYSDEQQNGGSGYVWTKEMVDELIAQPVSTCGLYFLPDCQPAFLKYRDEYIRGKRGMVFGSQSPWAEANLIGIGGADGVITVEYMNIVSQHPKITHLHPTALANLVVSGDVPLGQMDFIFSYSTFEHDGLGRYGDALNPYGDLEAIARAYCLLKPGGVMFLAVPFGPDGVLWNAHRVYGPIRMNLVLKSWKVLDLFGCQYLPSDLSTPSHHQPLWVLQKPFGVDTCTE